MATTTSPRTAAPLPLTRGRRAALIIGVPVCLALIADAGFSLVAPFAEGSYPVSRPVPAGTRSLTVTTAGGQLSVKPTAAGQATLTGTAHYSFIRSTLTERTAGGGTELDYHCVPLPSGTCDLDATVAVPPALPVTASTGGGNATVTGINAPVTLSTAGGSLSAGHVTGPLNLDTNGGNIQATAVKSARVTASTGGGNIEIVFASVPRDVRVNTAGGSITLVLPRSATGYDATVQADGGRLTDYSLTQNSSSSNVLTVTSGGGDITLRQQ